MRLIDLITAPWAILPESLVEIQQIYATHLKGEKIDIAAVEARLGRPLANEQKQYEVRPGGVAVLSMDGVMSPKANLMMQISGGASTQMLSQQIDAAMTDDRVKSLILAIDSPGGSVFGVPEFASIIADAAKVKPLVSVAEHTMASAALWAGAAANAVYLNGTTSQAGSIGVYARMGLSQPDPSSIEFARGKYKRSGLNGQAPSAEFVADFDARLDLLYTMFVTAMADYRGASVDAVLAHMADGRMFVGEQAVNAGLVDGIATVDALAEQLATNPTKFAKRRKAVFALGSLPSQSAGAQTGAMQAGPVLPEHSNPEMKGSVMDRKDLEQQHPALFAQLQAEFSAQATAAATAAVTASATAAGAALELQRIKDVRAQSLPGHEALIEGLAFDGKTTGAEAAMAVNAAERARIGSAAAAHAEDAPNAVPHAAAPADTKPTAQQIAAQAIAAHKAATGA